MTKVYDVNNVKVTFGGVEFKGLSKDYVDFTSPPIARYYTIKDAADYPKDHPDYAEDILIIYAHGITFRLLKDSPFAAILAEDGGKTPITWRFKDVDETI